VKIIYDIVEQGRLTASSVFFVSWWKQKAVWSLTKPLRTAGARKANASADEDLADSHWCAKTPRLRQRKAPLHTAMPPIHKDAQVAFDNLMSEDFDSIMSITQLQDFDSRDHLAA
jgi:hypothetical protein